MGYRRYQFGIALCPNLVFPVTSTCFEIVSTTVLGQVNRPFYFNNLPYFGTSFSSGKVYRTILPVEAQNLKNGTASWSISVYPITGGLKKPTELEQDIFIHGVMVFVA